MKQAELGKLQSQVVRSPERVKRETKELDETVERERHDGRKIEIEGKDLQTKVDQLKTSVYDMKQAVDVLKEVRQVYL